MRLLRKITYGEFSEFIQEKRSTFDGGEDGAVALNGSRP